MKKTQFKQILPAIQVLSIAAVLTILASSLVSFTIRSFSDDFLKQLGLSKPGAEEKIRHGFLSGSFDAYGVKNLKSVAASSRVALANDILAYSKKYVSSADFIKNYEELQAYYKPKFTKIQTPTEMREESIAIYRKGVADMEESYKKADASMKPIFEKMLASNKAELKKAEDPNNKSVVNYAKGYDGMVKSNQENYERQIVSPFPMIGNHVLLPLATKLEEADQEIKSKLSRDVISQVVDFVPDEWILASRDTETAEEARAVYVDFLWSRLEQSFHFVNGAIDARKALI